MKRYLAFCGDNYYPCGGMNDFIGDFDTLEQAIQAIDAEFVYCQSWAHVWDCETRTEVYTD